MASWAFPLWLSGKESPCQCWSHRRLGFDPWVGKIPWRRQWQPTPVFLPAKIPWTEEPDGVLSMRSLRGTCDWVHRHSLKGHPSHESWSSFFFEFSVTHNQACDELFRINHSHHFTNAKCPWWHFFFLNNSREVLSLFSTFKMLKQMWIEWKSWSSCL